MSRSLIVLLASNRVGGVQMEVAECPESLVRVRFTGKGLVAGMIAWKNNMLVA